MWIKRDDTEREVGNNKRWQTPMFMFLTTLFLLLASSCTDSELSDKHIQLISEIKTLSKEQNTEIATLEKRLTITKEALQKAQREKQRADQDLNRICETETKIQKLSGEKMLQEENIGRLKKIKESLDALLLPSTKTS